MHVLVLKREGIEGGEEEEREENGAVFLMVHLVLGASKKILSFEIVVNLILKIIKVLFGFFIYFILVFLVGGFFDIYMLDILLTNQGKLKF